MLLFNMNVVNSVGKQQLGILNFTFCHYRDANLVHE